MTTVRGAAWRLAVFAAVMVVVLLLVLTALQRPVAGNTETHDALFTDANGLTVGDDVRMYGVQVGKVESLTLDGDKARVRFTLTDDTPVYDNSTLAIRYQNLTGQRYIDLQQQPNPGARLAAGAIIGTDMTIPSFDVTSLFNGLKPVLATMSPEAINQFTESMLAVIEGDGAGIGPALDAIEQLSAYVGDRQQVIGTLVRNMSDIADRVGGRLPHLVPLLARLTDIFEALQTNVGGLAEFAMTAPSVLAPVDRLLGALGLTPESGPDIDAMIRGLFPDPQQAVEVFGRLPGLLASVDAAFGRTVAGWKPECSKGNAELPTAVQVLIGGQQVAICNA
ncbi:MlaD family protein [Nocardia donostiensis]|uniref:Mammalian cell entry protein n=1 Tax=Nocardia donostiensis TaxID=1538463 RepID=A0A1W0B213_9NOCA|nr:MCE family protein [Nocardia donostiensis]ONM47269.1 mammalian cell entry protein [Nocardia donostiensis]OQS16573.1 mammalian cell entry protein [Nocardia donostiensis]OQS21048.1 mammalian cell entry protein [Nocardia donostiensis]